MKKKKYIVLLLILFVTIGFAYLSSNLNILGSVGVKGNTWNVYLNNVVVQEGSVTGNAPVISNDKLSVSCTINLHYPGDYYYFSVDVVNGGTIDAILDSINKTELTADQKKYLDLEIRYQDNIPISTGYYLRAGATKKIYIKLSFIEDLTAEDLPGTAVNGLPINIEFNYVQAPDELVNSDSITFVLHKNGINPISGLEENVINFYDNQNYNQGNIVNVDTILIALNKNEMHNLSTEELYSYIYNQYGEVKRITLDESITVSECIGYMFYWKYNDSIGFVNRNGSYAIPMFSIPYRFSGTAYDLAGRLEPFSMDTSSEDFLFNLFQDLGLRGTIDLYPTAVGPVSTCA